ncbi:hypothetical protein [Paenibacillus marinisediminis]
MKPLLMLIIITGIIITGCSSSDSSAETHEVTDVIETVLRKGDSEQSKEAIAAHKEMERTLVDMETILSVVHLTAPQKLKSDHLDDPLSMYSWFLDVEEWMNSLLRYLDGTVIEEREKQLFLEAVQDYYSVKHSEEIFSRYYRSNEDGTYMYLPQDAYGHLHSTMRDLQVDIHKGDGTIEYEIHGLSPEMFYSNTNDGKIQVELFDTPIYERITLLTDQLVINSASNMK